MTSDISRLIGGSSLTLGSSVARSTVEPRSGNSFSETVGKLLRQLGGIAENVAGEAIGIDSKYQGLLDKQSEMQEQMLIVNLYSNILKSEHESKMAPVRNIRVG